MSDGLSVRNDTSMTDNPLEMIYLLLTDNFRQHCTISDGFIGDGLVPSEMYISDGFCPFSDGFVRQGCIVFN